VNFESTYDSASPRDSGRQVVASGPHEDERQARTDVANIYLQARHSVRREVLGEANHALLTDACGRTGVALGAYDTRILTLARRLGAPDVRGDRRLDYSRSRGRALASGAGSLGTGTGDPGSSRAAQPRSTGRAVIRCRQRPAVADHLIRITTALAFSAVAAVAAVISYRHATSWSAPTVRRA
jgi:hypothetical protein